ncbi:MAG: type II toxin-antitoxin system prevent-host-death family antitoxin [Acidobacteria bacterium]|nr:MAG: type II toxin-antitoxin system prevent-host-death family antitoxin [Acidobacteriota bacterium]
MSDTVLGVAEAKRRFSELVDRVAKGERFVICRRGKPAVAVVAPEAVSGRSRQGPPRGLAAFAGALSEWDELEDASAQTNGLGGAIQCRERLGGLLRFYHREAA